MKQRLLSDISNIYSIKISVLNKLIELSEKCICDYLLEAVLKDEDLIEINVGLGKLLILISDNSIEYQFIPSTKLEKNIIKTLTEMRSPLQISLEKGLEDKLLSTYKELF